MTAQTFSRAKLMITFAHIAMTGSISAAADQLKLDKGAVSRQLRQLEELLDARLMNRSTRGMVLTEVGTLVFERAQRVIQEVQDAEMDVQMLRSQPRGVLTVSASVSFGKLHVVPALPDFLQRYPDIDLQLCLLDRPTDLLEEGMDLLLRICEAPPENVVAHRLCDVDYALVATPALVRSELPVEAPGDLQHRACLFYGFKTRSNTWRFTQGGLSEEVQVTARVSVNSSDAVRDLALAGLGIALLPTFAIAHDLRERRLQRLLPGFTVRGQLGSSLYALHLPGRAMSPKIRCFLEFAQERWSGGSAARWE
ncbi:MAG: hypothetical protein RLZZ618_913 [Pseudomonadota bacterium]|jgi:DNA-binding transcriptional LysR family regulator